MKRGIIIILFVSILLISPLIQAQEQTQTYSGFNRFVDNVKMFFSFGDAKVILALEIREKEVDSAIESSKSGDNEVTTKNLGRAWKKLQVVQEKVSVDIAEEVKESSDEVTTKINNEENLSDNFELYVLEEEKTGLKAEWVIAVEGQEGQTLTTEVVGEANGERVVEIEIRMDEIDVEIKEWVVDSFNKTIDSDSALTWVVANKIVKEDGDDGLTREIKTYVAGDGTDDDEVVSGGNGGMAPGTSGTGTDGDTIDSGTIDPGDPGTEGPSDDTTTDDDVGETPSSDSGDDAGDGSASSSDSSSSDAGDSSDSGSDSGEDSSSSNGGEGSAPTSSDSAD